MTQRIFRSFLIIGTAILLATLVLIFGVLYVHFTNVQMRSLQQQTALVAQGIVHEGNAYFTDLPSNEIRITWIGADGAVLYDTQSDKETMENHLQREEILQAMQNGTGTATRYSTTMTERMDYAAQKLPDGSFVRLSGAQLTVPVLLLSMIQPILAIAAIALILSLVLAYRLTRRVIQPLNDMNLDDPLSSRHLEEIEPLLRRLDSQQKQLRMQKRELERRKNEFATATDGMQDGLILLDDAGVVLSINRAAARLLGVSRFCIGKDMLTLNNSVEMQELLRKCLDGQHTQMIVPIGASPYRVEAAPVSSEEYVTGAALTIHDITEAEKAEALRREFTANVSHELKTPLQTISGCAELMKDGLVRKGDEQNFAAQIYSEAQRMIRLVDDIIRLSKLDEGGLEMQKEDIDLLALAQSAAESAGDAARDMQVAITCTGDSAKVRCVKALAVSIVQNLVDNAVKYNRTNGRVEIHVEDRAQEAVLTVRDTGIGIPEESRDRIFERFYRVDKSHSRAIGGTGLGLSIVKHAARLIGARIELQSALDEGSTFTVFIPKN